MQVTVGNSYLNVRTGAPNVNAPNNTYLNPGDTIEVDGKFYKGDSYNGINSWMKDAAGNFYWSGGISLFQSWFNDLFIPQIWQYATGTGVGVAIVDTGVQTGITDLPLANSHFVYDGSDNISDIVGHGTYCAALVGLKKPQNNLIGVAPDSTIYVAKIADGGSFNNNNTDSERYAKAIDWCAGQTGVHVISISWGNPINDPNTKKDIQDAISRATAANKILVCSIGDATSYGDPTQYFPACCDSTIGVGSIPVEHLVYPYINNHLSVVLIGNGIDSIKIGGFMDRGAGTSWSNAIMAGIVALIIEKLNFQYDFPAIQRIMSQLITNQDYTIRQITQTLPNLDSNKLLNFFKT
jgi:hypothetical protein